MDRKLTAIGETFAKWFEAHIEPIFWKNVALNREKDTSWENPKQDEDTWHRETSRFHQQNIIFNNNWHDFSANRLFNMRSKYKPDLPSNQTKTYKQHTPICTL